MVGEFLAAPYYSQCTVFAFLSVLFSIINSLLIMFRNDCLLGRQEGHACMYEVCVCAMCMHVLSIYCTCEVTVIDHSSIHHVYIIDINSGEALAFF